MTTRTTTIALLFMLTGFPLVAAAQPPDGGEQEDEAPAPDQEQEADPSAGMAAPDPQEEMQPQPQPQPQPLQSRENLCSDGNDDDGDGMIDCADADCFEAQSCLAGRSPERGNEACSDWVDNDGDDIVDCDDSDCQRPGVTVCEGSDRRGLASGSGAVSLADDDIPELGEGMTVEDLIGNYGDADGERNDYMCSDGIDNDDDGRTDCADFGCRFDPSVSVCSGTPGLRFSVVAGIGFNYTIDREMGDLDMDGSFDDVELANAERFDVRFSRVQLRAFGPIPYVENSFFLMSARLERTPRLTFIHFQVPVLEGGYYVALNSGSGNLSSGPILSAAKQPLLEQPFYLYNAFEQGNGAAFEFGGPIGSGGKLNFRLMAAGGSGEFNGNVGGRFFRGENQNFTWTSGAQIGINFLGLYNRFDSPFLYTPAPLTLALVVGAKYDQRARERYPAGNALLWFQYDRFALRIENYTKRELEFGAWQTAWNAQLGILVIPKHIMLAADVGQFIAGEYDDAPEFNSALRRPLDEFQYRAAIHWFWYRNIGLLSARYTETQIDQNPDRLQDETLEREFTIEANFRF